MVLEDSGRCGEVFQWSLLSFWRTGRGGVEVQWVLLSFWRRVRGDERLRVLQTDTPASDSATCGFD